jgi:hypothetical protein
MYTVTLNELKAVQKVSAQEGQIGAVNKTSVESTTQDDDFQEVRDAADISLIIPHRLPRSRLNQSLHPQLSGLLQKQRELFNFFAPLRPTDRDMETTGAENTLPEQEATRKSCRPPPIVMAFTTNHIRLKAT